jgi:hypothetical protein
MHRPIHQRAPREATEQTLRLVIESIRAGNPEAFHTEETLKTRVFFNAPVRPLECAGFIRPYVAVDAQRQRDVAALAA